MNKYLTAVAPDSGHPFLRDQDGGASFGGSTEMQVKGMRFHSGLTLSERVAAGFGSAEDRAYVRDQNQKHKEWLASPAGQKF